MGFVDCQWAQHHLFETLGDDSEVWNQATTFPDVIITDKNNGQKQEEDPNCNNLEFSFSHIEGQKPLIKHVVVIVKGKSPESECNVLLRDKNKSVCSRRLH